MVGVERSLSSRMDRVKSSHECHPQDKPLLSLEQVNRRSECFQSIQERSIHTEIGESLAISCVNHISNHPLFGCTLAVQKLSSAWEAFQQADSGITCGWCCSDYDSWGDICSACTWWCPCLCVCSQCECLTQMHFTSTMILQITAFLCFACHNLFFANIKAFMSHDQWFS